MADQRSRGGKKARTNAPNNPDQQQGVQATGTNDNAGQRSERDVDRDRQNRDDPSRAPESGDRK